MRFLLAAKLKGKKRFHFFFFFSFFRRCSDQSRFRTFGEGGGDRDRDRERERNISAISSIFWRERCVEGERTTQMLFKRLKKIERRREKEISQSSQSNSIEGASRSICFDISECRFSNSTFESFQRNISTSSRVLTSSSCFDRSNLEKRERERRERGFRSEINITPSTLKHSTSRQPLSSTRITNNVR